MGTRRSLSRALFLALIFPAIESSTRTLYADPMSMTATATMVHNSGFSTPATNIGPFDLPFDPAPSISISSVIQDYQHGDPNRTSTLLIGGSKYFDPTRAVVLLAPGSKLTQFADGKQLLPGDAATLTLDVTAVARVDNWSHISGFFDAPVTPYVGAGGFAEYNVEATFSEYVSHSDGTVRPIRMNERIEQHLLFTSAGLNRGRLFKTIALPDVSLTPAEASAGSAGYFAFTIHAVVKMLDPDEQTEGSFELNFGSNLPGDYDRDGDVDTADYVLWRKDPSAFGGNPAGYDTWRANFGNALGSGSLASGTIPEPSPLVMLLVGMSASFTLRRAAAKR